jgi:hypothetical protein
MSKRCARVVLAIAAVITASGVSRAEVVESGPAGFTVRHVVTVGVPPAEAYRRLVAVGEWWAKEHTYSGDARNLTLDARAGGCFCEKLADQGSVMHGQVVLAQPGKALRLVGGLGPLQQLGVAAALTWSLTPTPGGTAVEMIYAVGGYRPGGMDALAGIVDQVLGAQARRYQASASQ